MTCCIEKTREEFLKDARELAIKFHTDKKYGDHPYVFHLDHVVSVMRRFGITDTDLLAAGYLHDAQEDTILTKEHISILMNARVAELVDAVTDGPGKNRQERKLRPYTLIPKVKDAILLKLADRIANLENGHASESNLVEMYQKEQPEFEQHLFDERKVNKGKEPRLARMWKYCMTLAWSLREQPVGGKE